MTEWQELQQWLVSWLALGYLRGVLDLADVSVEHTTLGEWRALRDLYRNR
jgi:hypothetical protein